MIYTFDNWAKIPILIVFSFVLFIVGCDLKGGKSEPSELSFSPFPANNFRRVPINTTIRAVFQSPLDPQSIHPDLFLLMDSSGNKVPCKLDYTPFPGSGTFVLILTPLSYSQTPPVFLNPDATYTVALGAGIKSQAGDAQTGLNTWSFKTNNSADFTPPAFNGLSAAQGVDMGSIKLTWGPATDNPGGTPSDQLIFSICYATNAFVCQTRYAPVLSSSTVSTDSNGNFFYVVKSLKPETTYYFIVRVEDLAGNRDTNTVVVNGKTRGGKLYVANFGNNEILAFDHPSKLSSSTATTVRSIKASLNNIVDPYGIFYDQVNNRLFISTCKTVSLYSLVESLDPVVCQPGSSKIAVYNNTPTLPGKDQLPDWTLVNSGLNGPVGVFLDNSLDSSGKRRDTLYVANFVGSSVTIYDNVWSSCQKTLVLGSQTCSVTPRANFTSPDLTNPFGIAFDPVKQFLYVSNYIKSFRVIDSNTGNITPVVPGSTVAVFNDNGAGSILKSFPGTYSAYKTISGFNSPSGLWLDSPMDTLYIANPGASLGPLNAYPGIVAICNVSLIMPGPQSIPGISNPCMISPPPSSPAAQYLAGSNTGLLWPVTMAMTNSLNSSMPSLYISDYSYNNVSIFSPNPLFSATTVSYNTSPNEILHGFNNEIRKPVGIAVSDSAGVDNLYVANSGWDQILFFDQLAANFSQCSGTFPPFQCSFPPQRLISSSISAPSGLFLNNSKDINGTQKDRLYISAFFNNSIVVLDGVSTLSGNAYPSIYKIMTSSAIQNPFGIFVDSSQSREWVYVVNSRKDPAGVFAGMFAVLVFDVSLCPANTIFCDMDLIPGGVRVIHSADFDNPAGIWVDEGLGPNNQPRDILFVSNRGQSSFSSPGSLVSFSYSSTLSGSVPATKIIQGDQTSLFTPAGLFMDSAKNQLYIANQGYHEVLVFNQPQSCIVNAGTNNCNIAPDRTIYNTADILHSIDAPSSIVIDFSSDQLYLSDLGLYQMYSSLLILNQASSVNGQAFISGAFVSSPSGTGGVYQLNLPEAIGLDNTR
ncbi:MAG: Ig-like domain-containing protein [Nitrospirae bacterium]|nr:Ig-like domain-containing protein [Nitrospirota bacterium]